MFTISKFLAPTVPTRLTKKFLVLSLENSTSKRSWDAASI